MGRRCRDIRISHHILLTYSSAATYAVRRVVLRWAVHQERWPQLHGKSVRKPTRTQGEHVLGPLERLDHSTVRGGEHARVVDLAQFRSDRPGQPLHLKRELGVDSGLVPARVKAAPPPFEMHGDEPVKTEGAGLVGEPLVTESGGDASGPKQRDQKMRLAVAEGDSFANVLIWLVAREGGCTRFLAPCECDGSSTNLGGSGEAYP